MRKLVCGLSCLTYLFGSFVLTTAAAIAWLWIIATAATQTHWTVGAAIFVGTLILGQRYEATIRWPLDAWRGFWTAIDAELEYRTR
jgi:hypothetical protein